eukprot:4990880-Prymnesium_polylepis.2
MPQYTKDSHENAQHKSHARGRRRLARQSSGAPRRRALREPDVLHADTWDGIRQCLLFLNRIFPYLHRIFTVSSPYLQKAQHMEPFAMQLALFRPPPRVMTR